MTTLETDYLVVGAGAAGMAFTDELIADSDADVVMVDRRHRPGGHWNDAYPFVRLHQPSAFYGVNSRRLGTDVIDTTGPNAGCYPRASAGEICDYFERVLDETLLPSGRVRFFGMCDYVGEKRGEHLFVSRLTGDETTRAGATQGRRRDVSRDPDPGDAHPVVRRRSRCALHTRQRSRHAVRARTRLHGDRRGQDRDGRVQLVARQRRRARCDPLDPAARRLDARPRPRATARSRDGDHRGRRGPARSGRGSRKRRRPLRAGSKPTVTSFASTRASSRRCTGARP